VSEARDYKVIGTRVVRPDGVDKVTGRANFGADFSLPGMLYGKVLRSPHAHARIKKIDTAAAAKIEGVYAIVTGADFPKVGHEEITGGEGAGDFADLATNVMARTRSFTTATRWLRLRRKPRRSPMPRSLRSRSTTSGLRR
jgi:CO/xanthine dehydrogenase Mo-binding subunit